MTDRATLPPRRQTNTFKLEWANGAGKRTSFLVSVGLFEDGSPAEAFLESTKMATDTQALARDAAILFSIARQYGTPLQVMQEGVSRNEDGTPQSLLGALLDGIAKEMGIDWGKKPSPHLKVVLPEAEPDVQHNSDMATVAEPGNPPFSGDALHAEHMIDIDKDLKLIDDAAGVYRDDDGGLVVMLDEPFTSPATDERMSLSLTDMPKLPGTLADTGPTKNVEEWKGSKPK